MAITRAGNCHHAERRLYGEQSGISDRFCRVSGCPGRSRYYDHSDARFIRQHVERSSGNQIASFVVVDMGDSTGPVIAQGADTFLAITPERPAKASSQTRVMLYATGLRPLIISNSLVVRAKTVDGRIFMLPVDYAGAGKILPGLDQIIVRLMPELAGAGQVTLTIAGATDSSAILFVQ